MSELRDQKFEQQLALQQLALERLKANRAHGLSQQGLALDRRSMELTNQMLEEIANAERNRGRGRP